MRGNGAIVPSSRSHPGLGFSFTATELSFIIGFLISSLIINNLHLRDLELTHIAHEVMSGRRKIAVKVVDSFANDTMTMMEVMA